MGFFADRLQGGLARDARALIGGDAVISSDNATPPAFEQQAQTLGLQTTQTLGFPTMGRARDEDGGAAKLVALKAVDTGYPLRGNLRVAASVLRGHKVHPRVRMLVVPGSKQVKRDAEAEGIDAIVRAAGAEWRDPGCSMCIAMNGDLVGPGQLAVSTSNRNFEGRQGKGARTALITTAGFRDVLEIGRASRKPDVYDIQWRPPAPLGWKSC